MAKAIEDLIRNVWLDETGLYHKLIDIYGSAETALAELNKAFKSPGVRSVRRLLNADGFKKEETSIEFRRDYEFCRLGHIVSLVRISDREITNWMIWVSALDAYNRWPSLYSLEEPAKPPPLTEKNLRAFLIKLGNSCGAVKAKKQAEDYFKAPIAKRRIIAIRSAEGIKASTRPRKLT